MKILTTATAVIVDYKNITMKAWEEIEQLHGRFICETLNGRFYIDGGLRIERKNNGTFTIRDNNINDGNEGTDLVSNIEQVVFNIDKKMFIYKNCRSSSKSHVLVFFAQL